MAVVPSFTVAVFLHFMPRSITAACCRNEIDIYVCFLGR